MKTFLRDKRSGMYLRHRGKWTSSLEGAFDFKVIGRAIKYVEKSRLHGAELVVASVDLFHLTTLPASVLNPAGRVRSHWHD
jgi:hypothetical protein